jgi:CHAD domain-containing protein
LKVPVGPEQRKEIHVPLGGNQDGHPDRIPAELAQLVTAWTGGRKLVPVAHIATTRLSSELLDADGRPLATLADDQVTAEAIGKSARLDAWRELEVELQQGASPKLLDAVEPALRKLRARPARSSSKLARILGDRLAGDQRKPQPRKKLTAGQVIGDYLSAQAQQLRTHDVGVRLGTDDAVHQMRVASRRLRSALNSFRRVLDRQATRDIASELQWLGRELSPARDNEVLEELLITQIAGQPTELVLGPVRASVTAHFAREQADARKKALDALNSPRYVALIRALDGLVENPPLTGNGGRPARPELKRAIQRANRRLERAERGVPEQPASDRYTALHEVRKKAKQARYTAEAAAPAFGKKLQAWTKNVKKIQSTLGDQHDRVVARDIVRELGVREHLAGNNAFTYGLLHRHNTAEAEHLEGVFREQWDAIGQAPRPRWLS